MSILGISVGTYRSGICVLQDDKLLDRHIHEFPSPWSETKLRIILKQYRYYLHRYSITAVIVKIPPKHWNTKEVLRLIRRTEALAKEYYCEFDLITHTEIKGTLLLRSSDELVKYTTHLYPELLDQYKKGVATKHAFNMKMYDAILAAHIFEKMLQLQIR